MGHLLKEIITQMLWYYTNDVGKGKNKKNECIHILCLLHKKLLYHTDTLLYYVQTIQQFFVWFLKQFYRFLPLETVKKTVKIQTYAIMN